jgi:hypothetical protein
MQLLLRRAALGLHTDGPADLLLAASPDSLARAPWQWDVRVVAAADDDPAAFDVPIIGRHHVVVRTDATVVRGVQRLVEVEGTAELERPRHELWLAVVETGSPRVGAFALAPGDVLVCEGDDPVRIELEAPHERATLNLVVLDRLDGDPLRWVP